MIAASNLAIGYGTTQVAMGIDLAVAPGEILCLLGPNGAGKTTLFKTLLGLIPALQGAVAVNGILVGDMSRAALARAVAYVPQAQVMEFAYTVLDLVLMGRTAHLGPFTSPSAADHDRARSALNELGILDLADREANRISGGQRQLALIARALAQDAPMMVMDEPTASLDLGNRFLVLARVQALRERGFGVVFSTHDPDQARELATRVAVIADGRLAAYGTPDETLTAATLSDVYGVPVALERTDTGRTVIAPAKPVS
ncbi:MAG: ABC transporter ATP-binding protein [Reyranella sp.]|uniref:ABC transporter ATP-binding protein n=1 Tax=Reyranella sp. TaxID=1929291 RepID=UPI0012043B73|nr:ABC transporter ATP-binding protein [Reyranella sp.]TAJ94869.1 MAG: ABC transporter ATP-binding protein [Reyranella sp.]